MKDFLAGTVHTSIPPELKTILSANKSLSRIWEDLTPLARNEWICWILSPKKQETRDAHIQRLVIELKQGKRRPCCWIGCIHRTDKNISPSVQSILDKKSSKKT